ncbi:MAG: CHAT domain-containing protein, partial [Chitinophagales bacterium]
LAQGYFHLAQIHVEKKDYETALGYAQKALHLNTLYFGGKDFAVAGNEYLIGKIYVLKNNPQKSLEYFHRSLDKLSVVGASQFMEVARCLCSIGEILNQQSSYQEALESIQKAIQILCSNFEESDIYKNPKLQDIPFDTHILDTLVLKASVFFNCYQWTTQNIRDYEVVLSTYQLVDELICRLRQSYHSMKAKLGLSARIATENYRKGIYAALNAPISIDKREFAFMFSEKAKGAILYASFQENIAKERGSIPRELLQNEKNLKIELDYLEKSIQKQERREDGKNEGLLEKFENDYFNIYQKYKRVVQSLEQDYPDYHQLKYQTETASIEEIQANLTANQWMVSYFIGESRYYIFLIGKKEFEVLDLEKIDGFEQLVEDFLSAIQNHKFEEYTQKGYELYQELLQPLEMYLIDPSMEEETVQQLIIIPHGILHYLPFEALICSRPKDSGKIYIANEEEKDSTKPYQSLDYALLHFEVSYHYSATLWHYLLNKQGERAPADVNGFVGFAPVYESEVGNEKLETSGNPEKEGKNRKKGISEQWVVAANNIRSWAIRSEALRSDGTWTPLPHSKLETEGIANLFAQKGLSAQTFLHEEATKKRFQEVVEKSRFLLIAAHGVVNDKQPKLSGLVFYPESEKREERSEKRDVTMDTLTPASRLSLPSSEIDCILSMDEAYQLPLQADLVVLSSCESGIGELAKGEGMMAVNRGFLYAGAKNVVSTLFKVYDRPSSLLTQYLFEEILEGESYPKALRTAKLRLLQLQEVDVKSWSGFVLIGT